MKPRYPLLFIAVGSVWIGACSSQDDELLNDPAQQESSLFWQACSDQPLLECAELEVLSDPDNSESETISLALNRLPSTEKPREGIILLNPGGPGGSGVEVLNTLVEIGTLPQSLTEKFDFVGFDPRGIGGSTAVDCKEFGIDDLDDYLLSDQDIEQFVEELTSVGSLCEQKYGVYLQQLGSMNVVHDMEAIRQASAEDKIHYIGYSYGTRLGALYLQTYPENSGHFILDASVRPESDVLSLAEGAVQAMQNNLIAMLEDCVLINQACVGSQLLTQLEDKVHELLSEGRDEEFGLVGELVFLAAQDPDTSPIILRPLYDYLQTGDITAMRDLYQLFISEHPDDSTDNTTAKFAVVCADDSARPTVNTLKTLLAQYNQVSNLFAEAYVSLAGACSGWPATQSALPLITTSQAPAALVIGGTSDAQTPAAWSEEMAQSIAGYYLESDHPGHTSVFTEQSACVDAVAEEFLLTGLQPITSNCMSD